MAVELVFALIVAVIISILLYIKEKRDKRKIEQNRKLQVFPTCMYYSTRLKNLFSAYQELLIKYNYDVFKIYQNTKKKLYLQDIKKLISEEIRALTDIFTSYSDVLPQQIYKNLKKINEEKIEIEIRMNESDGTIKNEFASILELIQGIQNICEDSHKEIID